MKSDRMADKHTKQRSKSNATKSLPLTTRCKLWFVRRWLRLLPIKELELELKWREMAQMINETWDKDHLNIHPIPRVQGIGSLGGAYTAPVDLTTILNMNKQRLSQQDTPKTVSKDKRGKNATEGENKQL